MAVYSFSTSDKLSSDEDKLIREIKEYCRKRKIVFSQVVVEQLRKWHEEQTNEE